MPSNLKLRYRQVHLDFHTSAACPDVGADFDAQAFAETVKAAHVNSMTVFSKCHHGFSYHPTRTGKMHPNLTFDLMGRQIEALHRAGIRAPIYVSIMWDDWAAEQHPEWIIINKEGKAVIRSPLSGDSIATDAIRWSWLDVASGYGDYVLAQVEEVCANYPADGFFFDINIPTPNYSPWAMARMAAAGVRADDDEAVVRYAEENRLRFFDRMSRLVRAKAPDATLFYNGTLRPDMGETLPYQTHFEVESLPTAGHAWGYLHYPIMARQARAYGVPFLGMTGRFHKSWADFGGLKTRDQLDYECATVVAAGGAVSVGDQLHPRGALDPAVYRLLAHSYGRIEALEPWLDGATPVAEVAILALERRQARRLAHGEGIEGAAQVLLEAGVQFDLIDASADFSRYKVLILADDGAVDGALAAKLSDYLADGGRLLVSGVAGCDTVAQVFTVPGVPVTMLGPAPTVPGYLRLDRGLLGGEAVDDYDYVFYEQAYRVQPVAGAQAYGYLRRALFNRTWEHFVSHGHAPVGDDLGTPLVVAGGNVVYIALPIFKAYRNHDYWIYRELAVKALRFLLPDAALQVDGPGWLEATLHTQPADGNRPARQIVHLVAYQPRRTLQNVPHVDKAWPLADVTVRVRRDGKTPTRAYLAPEQTPVPMQPDGNHVRVHLPKVGVHTVVVLE